MVSRSDPLESFLSNPLNAVHDSFSSFESGVRRAAKDLQFHLFDSGNGSKEVEFLTAGDGSVKKIARNDAVAIVEDRSRCSSSMKVPITSFLETIFQNPLGSSRRSDSLKKGQRVDDCDGQCANCLYFQSAWSFLADSFVPFKSFMRCFQNSDASPPKLRLSESHRQSGMTRDKPKSLDSQKLEIFSLEPCLGYVLDNLFQNLQMFTHGFEENSLKTCKQSPPSPSQFDPLNTIKEIVKGKKTDVGGFLSNMRFARVGGSPPSLVGMASTVKDEDEVSASGGSREEPMSSLPQKLGNGLLSIPLSNVERLRSTLSTVSLAELIEFVPHLGRSSKEHPDKKKLFSVQDFFRYTESEGKRFFEELDRDGDGQVTLEDLEIAMRKRKLPKRYAREFLRRTKGHLFSTSIGWKQFLSLMEQKEPTILRAYTTLCLSKSGTLQKNQLLTSLKSASLPANEDNAVAMMRYLNVDTGGSISYSHFRNFMLLLPSERLEDDPRNIWFEAATVVPVSPPVEIGAESVLKSALAGGLACALSTSVMHPLDTMKTRVQASMLSFPVLLSKLPQIGLQGLYRGSIPAILGQFSSHGLRTGIFEASKLVLINVAPTLPEIQVQSLASFCSTILGTAVRIPCEVMKQRLQAGIFENVGEAIVGTLHQDGIKGFFRGTGATLCREVPFYVAGMGLYAEAKKAAQKGLRRDLEPWETIVVGALSGGFAAVVTTPFDVMKTRMMTAPRGLQVSMPMMAFTILRQEGPLGLFKGAVPRFFWIAPLGAMNFAGYELARKAMVRTGHVDGNQPGEKRMAHTA